MAGDWVKDYKIKGEHTYDGIVFAGIFPSSALKQIPQLETTSEDVLVASFPKSGTTWMTHILSLLYPELCQEKDVPLTRHVPFIEYHIPEGQPDGCQTWDTIKLFKSRSSPRLLKTHLPARYFSKQVQTNDLKVVFVIREIKDTLVSYFHFYKGLKGFGPFPGTWTDFFELFKLNKLCHARFTDMIPSWLALKERQNVMVIKYEDLKHDPYNGIQNVAEFCGKQITEKKLEDIVQATSFSVAQKNPLVNYDFAKAAWKDGNVQLVRKGIVGDWVNYFTPEQVNYVEDLMDQYPEYRELYHREEYN